MIHKYYAKLLNPFEKGKDIYVKYVSDNGKFL